MSSNIEISKNTKIIIGISVAVGVIILIFFIWWIIKKRRQSKYVSSDISSRSRQNSMDYKLYGDT